MSDVDDVVAAIEFSKGIDGASAHQGSDFSTALVTVKYLMMADDYDPQRSKSKSLMNETQRTIQSLGQVDGLGGEHLGEPLALGGVIAKNKYVVVLGQLGRLG